MRYYILCNDTEDGILNIRGRKICFTSKDSAEYYLASIRDEELRKDCRVYWLKYDMECIDATGMTEEELMISEGVE